MVIFHSYVTNYQRASQLLRGWIPVVIPRPQPSPISKVQVAGQAMIAAAFQGGSIQVAERHQVHMRHLRLGKLPESFCRGWQFTTIYHPGFWSNEKSMGRLPREKQFGMLDGAQPPSPARFLLDVSWIETVATSSNNKSCFNPKWLQGGAP